MYAHERTTPQLRRSRHVQLHHGAKVEAYTSRRRCIAPDCDTVLSRYNPSDTCAAHAGWQDTRQRRYD